MLVVNDLNLKRIKLVLNRIIAIYHQYYIIIMFLFFFSTSWILYKLEPMGCASQKKKKGLMVIRVVLEYPTTPHLHARETLIWATTSYNSWKWSSSPFPTEYASNITVTSLRNRCPTIA